MVMFVLAAWPAGADSLRMRVIGGLPSVSQYTDHEEPFWRRIVPELTGGRLLPEIIPFPATGIGGQEMLPMIRSGAIPFGTAILPVIGANEPEFEALDLPLLNPTLAELRRTVAAFRPFLTEALRLRYDAELLAIYTYPAQVLWCARPFSSLSDLRGRRVRTSAAAQADLVTALGGTPVVTPFGEVVRAVRSTAVECAITGTLSGMQIGLHEVTTHVHSMAINWGVSLFAANTRALQALPEDLRNILRTGLADLERRIWEAADRETALGLACAAGGAGCGPGRQGTLTLVPQQPADVPARRELLREVVLERWIDRCGADCAEIWNGTIGSSAGLPIVTR
ncbi:TRAP transporter substrate-binding protein [Sabulicella glaciei]|uniref:TRAP transporter substrate-binding protein n=1 Tax=Sabulicella glaciei TaxID=2984948 RepID=A0ABT3NVS6_9PROT|nr:TRAP transporter substrate-binding protein [Roseococcus sp. MDT2-1-1]MCW8086265.1 TRAP transporter substrate-binding protein [Roseococcus sp. MDT2-1-1]